MGTLSLILLDTTQMSFYFPRLPVSGVTAKEGQRQKIDIIFRLPGCRLRNGYLDIWEESTP